MAISATQNDPRHYTSRDGRILPVGGTHPINDAIGELCSTCSFTPTRPVHFAVGQRVAMAYGRRGRVEGLVSKIGRRYVTISWTSRSGKRHESHRTPTEVIPIAQLRDARARVAVSA